MFSPAGFYNSAPAPSASSSFGSPDAAYSYSFPEAGSSRPDRAGPQTFMTRLWDWMDQNPHSQAIRWSVDGQYLVIEDEDLLVETVASRLFKQKNYASFARQLNIYGWRRDNSPEVRPMGAQNARVWTHDFLTRDTPSEMVGQVKRQASARKTRIDTPTVSEQAVELLDNPSWASSNSFESSLPEYMQQPSINYDFASTGSPATFDATTMPMPFRAIPEQPTFCMPSYLESPAVPSPLHQFEWSPVFRAPSFPGVQLPYTTDGHIDAPVQSFDAGAQDVQYTWPPAPHETPTPQGPYYGYF